MREEGSALSSAKGHPGCSSCPGHRAASEGMENPVLPRREIGVQKGEGLSCWCVQSQPGVTGGKGWTRSWCCIRLVLTGTAFPELLKLPFVQDPGSCNWKWAAPVGQSPEPRSSPVLFPSEGIPRVGKAICSPGQGHLGRAPGP